jgi:phospholipid-translocating ATPase
MLPRYVAKAYRVLHTPNDIDILRIVHKRHPEVDLEHDPLLGGRWTSDGMLKPYEEIDRTTSRHRRRKQVPRTEEDLYPMQQRPPPRPSLSGNVGSRTDMSTGLPMTDRGFGFSTEEGGVAIRRIQTNLSEHHAPPARKSGSRLRASRLIPSTLRRSLHSKRPPIPSQSGDE